MGIAFSGNAGLFDHEADDHTILGKLKYDANYPLYTSDTERYSFDQAEVAFDKVFASGQPVILFVHGRGNEPNKSLVGGTFVEGGAVRKLETQYKAKVLMFNWNSVAWMYDRSKPLTQMPAAAESLKRVLQKLKNYLAQPRNQKKSLTLLAHSMGSIVLETFIKQNEWPTETPLFSQVVLTSPDADNVEHWQWLSEISQVENVYVTINKDDDILEKSTDSREPGREALGRNPVLPLSSKATYLDLTKLGKKPGQATGAHEVFNKEGMKGQALYCQLFHQLISGQKPDLTATTDLTEQNNYFKIKFAINNSAPCFL